MTDAESTRHLWKCYQASYSTSQCCASKLGTFVACRDLTCIELSRRSPLAGCELTK